MSDWQVQPQGQPSRTQEDGTGAGREQRQGCPHRAPRALMAEPGQNGTEVKEPRLAGQQTPSASPLCGAGADSENGLKEKSRLCLFLAQVHPLKEFLCEHLPGFYCSVLTLGFHVRHPSANSLFRAEWPPDSLPCLSHKLVAQPAQPTHCLGHRERSPPEAWQRFCWPRTAPWVRFK